MDTWFLPLAMSIIMFVLWIIRLPKIFNTTTLLQKVIKQHKREALNRGWTSRRGGQDFGALAPELFGGEPLMQRFAMSGTYEGREVTTGVLFSIVSSGPTDTGWNLTWVIVRLGIPEYTGSLRILSSGTPRRYDLGGEDGEAFYGLAGKGLFAKLIALGRPAVEVRDGNIFLINCGPSCATDLAGWLDAAAQIAQVLAATTEDEPNPDIKPSAP